MNLGAKMEINMMYNEFCLGNVVFMLKYTNLTINRAAHAYKLNYHGWQKQETMYNRGEQQ